jgi:CheY-like chemotaxis protein
MKHHKFKDKVLGVKSTDKYEYSIKQVAIHRKQVDKYQGKGVDGIKITQMLKANPQTAKLPIILVTANARG